MDNKKPETKEEAKPEVTPDIKTKTPAPEKKPIKKAKPESPKVIIPDAPPEKKIDNSKFIAKLKAKKQKAIDKRDLIVKAKAPSKDIQSMNKKIERIEAQIKNLK